MTVKRRDFQKIATTMHQFLLKLTDTYECAELRDSLNMSLLQLQKYYRKCQQRLQHTGRHNESNGTGYVSPRQSLRITLSRTSEALSPMTPYIEEPQYFHVQWTVLDEKADRIRKSICQENLSPQRSINTPIIHYAAKTADFDLLDELFREKKHVLEDQDCLGRTPLMYAVYHEEIEVVRWLLKRDANPNSCDLNEMTSLHWACFKANVTLIELLLDAGADINCQDSFGRSACHWACTLPTLEPLQLLIEFETKVNQHDKNGLTPAMWACRLDHLSHLNLLSKVKNQEIDHIDGYERDRNGRTIIHWSIRRQQPLECLKFLLNELTVQLKDDEGKNVLLLSAEQGALESCKVIIEKFGSKYIHDVDDNDRTSLILATLGGHGEVVNFLLENGANLNAKDKSGASCIDIARNQYLFYCQLIISSHIREIEKRRESIPSDCVELIEKATTRRNSMSESRALVKTPPRPPRSPKSSSSQTSKSPTSKRRLIKYNREQSVDHDEEMPNGFDAMSTDSYRFEYKTDANNEKNYHPNDDRRRSINDHSNKSQSLDNIQYQESATIDMLNNDYGQQYHGSYEHLKANRSAEHSICDNVTDVRPIREAIPQFRPFQRAKKINKINSKPSNVSSNRVSETPNGVSKSQEVMQDDVNSYSAAEFVNKPTPSHAATPDPPQKINYGASLEPINKISSSESVIKRKKKKSKDHQTAAKSQDRLENLHFKRDKHLNNLEPLSHAKSLENVSNKFMHLPNGLNINRLISNNESSSMAHNNNTFQGNRSVSPLTGRGFHSTDHERTQEKLSRNHIEPLESLNSNWGSNGQSSYTDFNP